MQETYEVAHIHEQGQDLIIVVMSNTFSTASNQEQDVVHNTIQNCATSAGLIGTVCLVWEQGTTFYFRAPDKWSQFFKSINMAFVLTNINRKLACRV